MPTHVRVAPNVIEWATDRARLEEADIERRFPEVALWLRGEQRPTLKQLENFALKVHAPFGYLLLDEPPDETVPIPDFRTLRDEELARPSAGLLDTIYVCQRRQDWYRAHLTSLGATRSPLARRTTPTARVGDVARAIREELSLNVPSGRLRGGWQNTHSALIERVEDLGVLVMANSIVGNNTHRPLDANEFRGFALADDLAPLIFINGRDSKAAQVFTLIHELAHIWVGETALSDPDSNSAQRTERERWCNRVAAEVLVPSDDFPNTADDLSASSLEALAQQYGVSTLVILHRYYELGLMEWEPFRSRYVEEEARIGEFLKRPADKKGGDHYNNQYRRLSPTFARAVIAATLEGETSFTDAYDLLDTRKHSTFVTLAARLKVA